MAFTLFESPTIAPKVTPNMGAALNRIAISHLTVTLAKMDLSAIFDLKGERSGR